MMFWLIVGVAIAVVLVLAWRTDRRRRGGFPRSVPPPENDRAVGEARIETYRRNMGGLGPGSGP